jgi:hypothetical protein
LVARKAPVAIVFRRGPSKQVLLVRWNLSDDSFEAGQWLKGRVYERRCDLSEDGERLIYFAANYRARHPLQTWTAVSRPPYFTALALWQKGDAWGGGGLFPSQNEILINHPAESLVLADGAQIPRDVKVLPLANAGRGEDAPIVRERMSRDGWVLMQEGHWVEDRSNAGTSWTADPAETWHRVHPRRPQDCALQMRTHGIHELQGSWYVTSYELVNRAGQVVRDLGRADWADWDSSGDLLLARAGKMFRTTVGSDGSLDLYAAERELIDLSGLVFEAREPVPEATRWAGPPPRGTRIAATGQGQDRRGSSNPR